MNICLDPNGKTYKRGVLLSERFDVFLDGEPVGRLTLTPGETEALRSILSKGLRGTRHSFEMPAKRKHEFFLGAGDRDVTR